MNWSALLGIDMAGKLSAWKRRYKGNWLEFDYRNVWCTVTQWYNGVFTVSASAYCADIYATGIGQQSVAWFYKSTSFRSRIEAEAHLEVEIRRATEKHLDTKFFRRRSCLVVENGRIGDTPVEIDEFCQGGVWYLTDHVPSCRRCRACGHETKEVICPKCGEFVID